MYFVEPILILGGREVLWASVRNHTIILCGVFLLMNFYLGARKFHKVFKNLVVMNIFHHIQVF